MAFSDLGSSKDLTKPVIINELIQYIKSVWFHPELKLNFSDVKLSANFKYDILSCLENAGLECEYTEDELASHKMQEQNNAFVRLMLIK